MQRSFNYKYRWLFAICLFIVFTLVYRREARMRVKIEAQEARIATLENRMAVLERLGPGAGSSARAEAEAEADSTGARRRKASATTNATSASGTRASGTRASGARASGRAKTGRTGNLDGILTQSGQEKAETIAKVLTDDNAKAPKFASVVRQELNTVDSTTLVRIPGIGARTAETILQYRKKLGGFYSPEQLREVLTWDSALPYLNVWCREWFYADARLVNRLNVNRLTFRELLRHPYLEYGEVKAIFQWRQLNGDLHGRSDLEQLGVFADKKLEKLLHYIEF
jgi:DNA uptake protein ComE-like DNA-binding protein